MTIKGVCLFFMDRYANRPNMVAVSSMTSPGIQNFPRKKPYVIKRVKIARRIKSIMSPIDLGAT
jgi:hypothetical protein